MFGKSVWIKKFQIKPRFEQLLKVNRPEIGAFQFIDWQYIALEFGNKGNLKERKTRSAGWFRTKRMVAFALIDQSKLQTFCALFNLQVLCVCVLSFAQVPHYTRAHEIVSREVAN